MKAQESPHLKAPFTVSTETDTSQLDVGLDPNATEGIDANLEEEPWPPPPPLSAFDIRLIDDDIPISGLETGVRKDFRPGPTDFVGEKIHEVRIQPGDSTTAVTLSWDLPSEATALIEDVATDGSDVSESVSGEGSLTLENESVIKLVVTVSYDLNSDPVVLEDDYTTPLDSSLSITASEGVLANDSDPDADSLTASLAPDGSPSNGALDLQLNGAFTYTPDPGFGGTDSFTYEASDGNTTDQATVTISVLSPPTAEVDSFSTAEEEALIVDTPSEGVLANDSDPNGDPLSTSLVSGTSKGSLTLHEDGTFTYQPEDDFNGPDTFQYVASDGTGRADTAQVTISVVPVNDAPTISDLNDQTISEDSTTGPIAFTVADEETVADSLSLSAMSGNTALVPDDSIITAGPDEAGNASVRVAPHPDSTGATTIALTVSDGEKQDTSTFALTVQPNTDSNTDPIAQEDHYPITPNSTLSITASEGVLANDSDPDADSLTASLASGGSPSSGSLDLQSNGAFTYTPDPEFAGTDSFTYEASDGKGGSDQATVTISVPSPPTAKDDSFSTKEKVALVVDFPSKGVLANDTDPNGDPLSASLLSASTGSLTLEDDGTFAYLPEAGFTGTDQFQYVASDGTGRVDTAQATISVLPVNDAPTISDIADQTIPESSTTGAIAFSVGDNETPPGSLSVSATSANADLVPDDSITTIGPDEAGNASVTVTPRPESTGATTIAITVSDGEKETSTSFNLHVEAVEDAPEVLMSLSNDTLEIPGPPTELAGLQGGVFGGVEGDAISYTGTSSAPSVLSVDENEGGVVLQPSSPGNADVTLTASGTQASTTTEPFTVTVVERSEGETPPTAHALAAVGTTDGVTTLALGDVGVELHVHTVGKRGVTDVRFFDGTAKAASTNMTSYARSTTTLRSKSGAEEEFESVSPYWWDIDAGTAQFDSIDVEIRLSNEDVRGVGGDPQSVTIIVDSNGEGNYQAISTQYDDGGTPADSTDDRLVAEGLTAPSTIRLASNSDQNPLPVELSSFDATLDGSTVLLQWRTASETHNAGFEVQRRVGTGDEGTWSEIGFVEGEGTTSESRTYEFEDVQLPFEADRLAYRLKQVDTDGTVNVSEEVEVTLRAPEEPILHAPYPNPARSQATVQYELSEETDSQLALYDLLGRRVVTLTDSRQDAGRKQVQIETSHLSSGTYLIRLTAGTQTKTRRLLVRH